MEFEKLQNIIAEVLNVDPDEITPDTARFWDAGTHEPLDIDRFRRDMDNVAEAYQEVLHRMMGVG